MSGSPEANDSVKRLEDGLSTAIVVTLRIIVVCMSIGLLARVSHDSDWRPIVGIVIMACLAWRGTDFRHA